MELICPREQLYYFELKPPEGEEPPPLNQNEWEFEQVLKLYRERAPLRVLEIGTQYGGSLFYWLGYARPGAQVVSVDIAHKNPEKYHYWVKWSNSLHVIGGSSLDRDVQEEIEKYGPYNWIMLDGDHTYDGATSDWNLACRLSDRGNCVVIFHDIVPMESRPELKSPQVWDEIREEYEWDQFIAEGATQDGTGVVYL